MRGQITSLAAAAVFSSALSVLLLFAVLKIASLPHASLTIPLSESQGAPARWIHVFYSGGVFVAVDAGTPSPYVAEALAGVNGVWVATFKLWPGGYTCLYNSSFALNGKPISKDNPLKIGEDPYTGLWCPPPWSGTRSCPNGVPASMGRILAVMCIS